MKKYIDALNKYFSSKEEVLCVYIFGSAAKGEENVYSDLDIAILYHDSVPISEYTDRQVDFSVKLSQLLDKNVDVIILNRAAPYLKFQIIKEGMRIYEKARRRDRSFEAHSIIEYFDFLPIKNLLEASMLKRIKEHTKS